MDLTIGPPIEEGFYYDCSMGDATLSDSDLGRVEKRVQNAIKVRVSPRLPRGALAEGRSSTMQSAAAMLTGLFSLQEKQRFQRIVVSRSDALAMFQENKFKIEIIQGLPEVRTWQAANCAATAAGC